LYLDCVSLSGSLVIEEPKGPDPRGTRIAIDGE
jgi:hypothetical protein